MGEIVEPENVLSDEERVTLVNAFRAICNKLNWKPGKDIVPSQKTPAHETPVRLFG